jgi:hypothetical protein
MTNKKTPSTSTRSDFDEAALFFHRYPKPGKLEIQATIRSAISATLRLLIHLVSPPPASQSMKIPLLLPNIRRAAIWSQLFQTAPRFLALAISAHLHPSQ